MDSFAEYLVKKRPDAGDRSKKTGIIFAAAVLCLITIALTIYFQIPLILIITCALIYLAYYLVTNLSVEYEYAVTNGELDVDKIIAKRKREHLVTVNVRKFTAFGAYSDEISDKPNATLVLCSDNTGHGAYYADVSDEELGEVRVIFTPNDTILAAIADTLPPLLKRKFAAERPQ